MKVSNFKILQLRLLLSHHLLKFKYNHQTILHLLHNIQVLQKQAVLIKFLNRILLHVCRTNQLKTRNFNLNKIYRYHNNNLFKLCQLVKHLRILNQMAKNQFIKLDKLIMKNNFLLFINPELYVLLFKLQLNKNN